MRRIKGWGPWAVPIAPRYVGLLWMSIMCVLCGLAYAPFSNIPQVLPPGLNVIGAIVPVWVFGLLWLVFGIWGIITILRRQKGEVVFAGQVALFFFWGISFLMAWFLGAPRSWVSAGIFLVFAGATWSFTRVDPPLRLLWKKVRFRWTRSSPQL